MTFKTFALTYVLGGLTFLPLLIACIIIPAWLLLPQIEHETEKGRRGSNNPDHKTADSNKELEDDAHDESFDGEGSASGVFAVLRSYDLQVALTALAARNTNGTPTPGSNAPDGSAEANESMYQSMYRSVFKGPAPVNAVLEKDEDAAAAKASIGKKAVAASIFYIVQRHGHLMLYDSPAQLEVRHVISLAHHDISLSGPGPETYATMPDAELFIKRTAIVLTPINQKNGQSQVPANSKPFYLFSPTCTEKEDFYHALLSTRSSPPIPRTLVSESLIKLQSTLHSSSLTPETRAINALISRIFLALQRTAFLEQAFRTKIEKKISRVQKPAFIAALDVRSIDMGDAAPVLSNLRLRDLNISGDLTIAMDVKYTGCVKVVISALAKIDLGPHFKARTVDLVLAASLQKLQGHMLVRIKPPPSNRMWFCFETLPEMDIKIEPVVSQRQITYAFILRAIEEKVRATMMETMVKPNWDDSPFFDTTPQRVRGGIWKSEGADPESETKGANTSNEKVEPSAGDLLAAKGEKTSSMPSLPIGTDGDSATASLGADGLSASSALAKESADSTKRRSAASLPLEPKRSSSNPGDQPSFMTKTMRAPTFTPPSPSAPSVAVDGANVASVRSDDATLQPKRWLPRPSNLQQSKKDAVGAIRDMKNRSFTREGKTSSEISRGEAANSKSSSSEAKSRTSEESKGRRGSESTTKPGSRSGKRNVNGGFGSLSRSDTTDSAASTASSNAAATMADRMAQERDNFLAATSAAADAARNWSWGAFGNGGSSPSLQSAFGFGPAPPVKKEPIGRGQPLPPPGTPLPPPPPPKSLWDGFGDIGGFGASSSNSGGGSTKRKPVPLSSRKASSSVSSADTASRRRGSALEEPTSPIVIVPAPSDSIGKKAVKGGDGGSSFGAWSETSGSSVVNSQLGSRDELEKAKASVATSIGEPFTLGTSASSSTSHLASTNTAASSFTESSSAQNIERAPSTRKAPPPPLPTRPQTGHLASKANTAPKEQQESPKPAPIVQEIPESRTSDDDEGAAWGLSDAEDDLAA